MKLINLQRGFLSALSLAALFIIPMIFSGQVNGQTDLNQPKGSPEQMRYSPDELEALRGKLLEVVDTVKDFSQTLKPGDVQAANNLERARTQIEHFSAKELSSLRASMDPSKMNAGLERARTTLEEWKPGLKEYFARTSQPVGGKKGAYLESSVSFPTVEDPDAVCSALVGTGRPSSEIAIAADAVYFAAKILDIALNRGCNQVVVAGVIILGEGGVGGGNTSLACIVSDGILFVAEQLRNKIQACDDDFTKRSIDASVARLGHLHTDIENSVANDNANTTTITGAVTTASNTITSNDNTNKTTIVTAIANSQGAIVTNANSNTTALTTAISNTQTAIITNDNTNKNTIVTNDNANKNTIVANDNANAAMLSNLLLRLQIEADLATNDSATPVALFMTPETRCGLSAPLNQCGLLGLVRQIVVQTIANLAGANASQANSFLAKGDQYRTAGNYASAYQNYRQAYKSTTK